MTDAPANQTTAPATSSAGILATIIITIGGGGWGGSDGVSGRYPGECFAIIDTEVVGPWAPRADEICHLEDAPQTQNRPGP